MYNEEKIFKEIQLSFKKQGIKTHITKATKIKSLGLDSLDLMDLIIELEEKLDITIPDDKLLTIKTINDLLVIVKELI